VSGRALHLATIEPLVIVLWPENDESHCLTINQVGKCQAGL
jgi:hypothetical protein